MTGEEFPFYTGSRHFVPGAGPQKKGVYVECAQAILDENGKPGPCVVCAYTNPALYDLNVSPIQKYSEYNASIYYGIAGWIEEWFHEVEKPNRNDQSKTHKERERCKGRGCDNCRGNVIKVFGRKFYTAVARTHWNDSIYRTQEQISSNCRCGGFIYTQDWVCPGCQNMVVDLLNNCFNCNSDQIAIDADEGKAVCQNCQADWSVFEHDNPEISKVVNQDFRCSCGVEDLPQPRVYCSNEGCEGDGYGIFDAQLKLTKTGEGTKSELHVDDVVIQEADSKLFDPQWQGAAADAEHAEKVAVAMKSVLDLFEIMGPDTPETQAQLLGVPNPFAASASGQSYKSYQRPGPKVGEQQEQQ